MLCFPLSFSITELWCSQMKWSYSVMYKNFCLNDICSVFFFFYRAKCNHEQGDLCLIIPCARTLLHQSLAVICKNDQCTKMPRALELQKDAFCVTYANDEKHARLLLCWWIGVGNKPLGHLEFVLCFWVCAVLFNCEREEKKTKHAANAKVLVRRLLCFMRATEGYIAHHDSIKKETCAICENRGHIR